ncbi:MAG: acetoacetate--CoA ligase [Desulfohalobiaceae bacterium]|nr:acetoacetate--CoA ligase [Desulfohalobiaceae bacterium]
MSELLWQPSQERINRSNMTRFMEFVNERMGTGFSEYAELYDWSVHNIPDFWAAIWDFMDVIHSRGSDQVVDDAYKMPGATWFSGAKLNFAENLLRYRDEELAIIFWGEASQPRHLTFSQLYSEVARVAASMREMGIQPGDRVVGYMPNVPETVIAMLAASSLGAVWSSCSPDFGIQGVLDRFGQIQPRLLFTIDGYSFKGKHLDVRSRLGKILEEISSVERVVMVPFLESDPDISSVPKAQHYEDFCTDYPGEIEFTKLPFEHPQYIMYSSGTTGKPKCMVHGAGGVLLNHLKELALHTDLGRGDRLFYFTTCGWMMWNWLVSALACGSTIVLYDGNPFYPDPEVLWRMAEQEKVTAFGTSAGYITGLQNAGVKPGRDFDLSPLRTVMSTGSPLPAEGFEYVYSEIKRDVQLASIAGGTDLIGCFFLGNPIGPVYAGELQCRGLGMKVQAYDDQGNPVINQKGELVCTAAFPSMPLYFWDDPDGAKYRDAYFDVFPGIWRHGDFIEVNDRGGVVIYGRSDATLNPGGVRIGTAEIYRQVDLLDEVEDSLVVGQDWGNDQRVVLFVKPNPGYQVDDELRQRIKKTVRENASPRHVPAKIIQVPDIPYTLNMKKVELAVKRTLQGQEVKNKDALRNPESLQYFEDIPELQQE